MGWLPWGVVRRGPPKTAGRLTTNGWVSTQQVARETGEIEIASPLGTWAGDVGKGVRMRRDRARVPGCAQPGPQVGMVRRRLCFPSGGRR